MRSSIRSLGIGLVLLGAGVHLPVQAGFDEGIEYRRLTTPVPNHTDSKQEVVELFWYGCPHCFQFEPKLERWVKNKPDNVAFVRVPAVFSNPVWALHAKMYYTAEILGKLEQLHHKLFEAIHIKNKRLASEKEIEEFFLEHGVSREDFRNTFNSFAVDSKLRRAKDLSERYGISGVPAIVINGTYLTDGPMSGSLDAVLAIMDQLLGTGSKN